MTAPLIADALGPRGRRRVVIATVVSGIGVLAVIAVAVGRLVDKGQLDADRWRPLTQGSVVRFLLGGLANTAKVAAVAMALAMAVGAVTALGRLSRNTAIRWIVGTYVELFRAIPLILLILFARLGLPEIGIEVSLFWTLVLALVAYNGAILCEIFRAGILSLDRGQSEAAYSIGLGYWGAMGLVIVPQAARRMIPAIVSQLVILLKDTSLGYVISFEELLRRAEQTGAFYGNVLQSLTLVAVVYIIVNFSLGRVAHRLETRQRRRFGAGPMTVRGVEDLAVTAAQNRAALGGGGPGQ